MFLVGTNTQTAVIHNNSTTDNTINNETGHQLTNSNICSYITRITNHLLMTSEHQDSMNAYSTIEKYIYLQHLSIPLAHYLHGLINKLNNSFKS